MKKWRVVMAVPLVGLAVTAGTATAATGTPSGAPPSGVTCVSVTRG